MIDVVAQQMAQLHKMDRALDRETAGTGIWVLDTGVMEHRALSLGVLRKDVVKDGEVRVRCSNERVREHKIVSVSNANSQFYDRRTLDRSNPEVSTTGFDMGIITDSMRAINGWRR